MQSIFQPYFERKPPVLYFDIRNTLVATTPLVMTRSLSAVTRAMKSVPEEGAFDVHIRLARPETERFLSAYNKKVLSSRRDPAKRALLHATGLSYNISMEAYLQRLIDRKHAGLFIDRHFVPQEALYGTLPDTISWRTVSLDDDIPSILGPLPKIKSSDSLTYHDTERKRSLNQSEEILLQEYLDLWT